MKKCSFACLVSGLLIATLMDTASADLILQGQYKVVVDRSVAAIAEQHAADELSYYLGKVFRKGLVTEDSPSVVVGYYGLARTKIAREEVEELGEEGFRIRSDPSGTIFIVGKEARGTMYGVYWFLDRLLGVHWYTPEYEFIPQLDKKVLPALDICERPAFAMRGAPGTFYKWKKSFGVADARWCARNLINQTGIRNLSEADRRYGGEIGFCPPVSCHAMHRLIPPAAYFKSHPEWWALQDGKRTHRDQRGVSASYCLTNQGLIEETIKRARYYLSKEPTARYISIQEGDRTVGPCECETCQKLLKKVGGFESGMWVDFANKVAGALKNEFPHTKFVIFAYTRTKLPPMNITVAPNVAVQLCVWGGRRGLPYNHPQNEFGKTFIEKYLRPWLKLTPNVLIWDYIFTFRDVFLQDPNPLVNIDNFRFFKHLHVEGIYPQNACDMTSNGQPFKSWMVARALWNPDSLDGEDLLKTFCREYYGEKAGSSIEKYWKNLRLINERQGFWKFCAGGAIGPADYLSCEATFSSESLFRKALKSCLGDRTHHRRVQFAYLPVQYHMLKNWKQFHPERIGLELEEYFQDAYMVAEQTEINYVGKMLNNLKKYKSHAKLPFKARASNVYWGTPYDAFDHDLQTSFSAGASSGWLEIEFPDQRVLKNNITTVLWAGVASIVYEIQGSIDGKKWHVLVPKHKATSSKEGKRFFIIHDSITKAIPCKYVRTRAFKLQLCDKRPGDFEIYEQLFDEEPAANLLK